MSITEILNNINIIYTRKELLKQIVDKLSSDSWKYIWKQMEISYIEGNKDNENILMNLSNKFTSYISNKYNKSEPLNLYFFASGRARSEVYLLIQLKLNGYNINKVCFMDTIYYNRMKHKESKEKVFLTKILLILKDNNVFNEYKILHDNANLAKYLNKIMINFESDLKILNEYELNKIYGVHALIGIHFGFSPVFNYIDGKYMTYNGYVLAYNMYYYLLDIMNKLQDNNISNSKEVVLYTRDINEITEKTWTLESKINEYKHVLIEVGKDIGINPFP